MGRFVPHVAVQRKVLERMRAAGSSLGRRPDAKKSLVRRVLDNGAKSNRALSLGRFKVDLHLGGV